MKDFASPITSIRKKGLVETFSDIAFNKTNLRTTLVGGVMLIAALSAYPVYTSLDISNQFSASEVRKPLSDKEIADLKNRQQQAMQEVSATQQNIVQTPKVNLVSKTNNLSLEPQLVNSTLHYLQLGAFSNQEAANTLYNKFDNAGFEVLRESKVVNGQKLETILVNYYNDQKLRSFIEGQAKIETGILVKKEGKTKFYSTGLKKRLIEKRCEDVGLDKDIFLAIRQNESANGKHLFGFDFVAKYQKYDGGEIYTNNEGKLITAKKGEFVRNDKGKLIVKEYVHRLDENGKIAKLTAVGEYHMNPEFHGKVRDLVDYDYNLQKSISHVTFLHKHYTGDLGKMASGYVAGTNGNFKRKEVINYRDAVLNTFRKLKDDELKNSMMLAQK